jgi:transcriptional regulator
LYATHLPLVYDATTGAHGVLRGHIARAHPHHVRAQDTSACLVVFTGADAYITPGWYASKARHGKVVPTWNYVAVHVSGVIRFRDDREFLMAHLDALTTEHEADQAHPWAMHDAPAHFIEQLAKAIVGVEIEIVSLEGKWKMSQNRADEDIDGVISGLTHRRSAWDQLSPHMLPRDVRQKH